MKKLLIGIVAMSTMAAVAMAAAPTGFDVLGGPTINIPENTDVWIGIAAASAGTVQGVNLNVGTAGGLDNTFVIQEIDLITGTCWLGTDNYTGYNNYGDAAQETVTTGSTAGGRTGWNSTFGSFSVASGQLIAKVRVHAGAFGAADQAFTTNYTNQWQPSNWAGDSSPQTYGSVMMHITPEPASVLFLLAGLPMLRRRRA